MPLNIKPITVHDTLAWTRIRALAYYGPLHDLIHRGPVTENSMHRVAQDRQLEIGKPNAWQWKVVDTDLPPSDDDPKDNGGRTIAIAIWSAHNFPEKTKEQGESDEIASGRGEQAQPFVPPEVRLDVLTAVFEPLRAAQEEIMGKDVSYLKLDSLATHPDHQGRGAGKMLLESGLKKADGEGLRCYLCATAKGLKLYEKAGFEMVKDVTFDMGAWGGEGQDWWTCMTREVGGKRS